MADEGVLYEGLRLGSRQAFEELLAHVDPTMRRLGRLYVTEAQVTPLVRTTWSVALPGLDMFAWHTTLRAWLTGIFVTYARAAAASAPPVPRDPPTPPAPAPVTGPPSDQVAEGPLPWETLGWSRWWRPEHWDALDAALAARPLAEREVLWLHDVERWEWRETLDCLGLTGDQGSRLRERGREALADRVVALVGAGPEAAGPGAAGRGAPDARTRRLDGVSGLLSALARTDAAPTPDPRLRTDFAAWRRRRGVPGWRRWRWELARRSTPGRAG